MLITEFNMKGVNPCADQLSWSRININFELRTVSVIVSRWRGPPPHPQNSLINSTSVESLGRKTDLRGIDLHLEDKIQTHLNSPQFIFSLENSKLPAALTGIISYMHSVCMGFVWFSV
jgi:hypothetical protein